MYPVSVLLLDAYSTFIYAHYINKIQVGLLHEVYGNLVQRPV
jgi:hypothetical protein